MNCVDLDPVIVIENGDCLKSGLWGQQVNCIITDPPYGMSYSSCRIKDKSKRLGGIKGDAAPFVWFLRQAFECLSDPGCLVCFCHDRSFQDFTWGIELAGFDYRSQLVWDRQVHGMGNLKSSFAPQHDLAIFATKGKFQFPGKRPKSVMSYQRVPPSSLVHPTEKPLELMKHLVEHLSQEGDVVMDPFMGSGVTGVAACELGRGFIGIELDEKYYNIAKERLGAK